MKINMKSYWTVSVIVSILILSVLFSANDAFSANSSNQDSNGKSVLASGFDASSGTSWQVIASEGVTTGKGEKTEPISKLLVSLSSGSTVICSDFVDLNPNQFKWNWNTATVNANTLCGDVNFTFEGKGDKIKSENSIHISENCSEAAFWFDFKGEERLADANGNIGSLSVLDDDALLTQGTSHLKLCE